MIPLLRAVALLGLLLLPIQMRAGAASPHPHALLHLLLDARDGAFDHHTVGGTTAAATDHNVEHVDATGFPLPDIPAYATFITAAGGLAVLAVVVADTGNSRPAGQADVAAARAVARTTSRARTSSSPHRVRLNRIRR